MKKRLLTEADLKRMQQHNALDLSGNELLTPQAKDYLLKVKNGQTNGMRVAIGADHRGFYLKESIKGILEREGKEVVDMGTFSDAPCDYPDYAAKVARCVASGDCTFGIMINGKGNGSAITCNKIRGIRAAVCHDAASAKSAREHNDANILALGSDQMGNGSAPDVVKQFLSTPFAGGRHKNRIDKISLIEKRNNASF
jgi:ribose 5-phosphate isomerase B